MSVAGYRQQYRGLGCNCTRNVLVCCSLPDNPGHGANHSEQGKLAGRRRTRMPGVPRSFMSLERRPSTSPRAACSAASATDRSAIVTRALFTSRTNSCADAATTQHTPAQAVLAVKTHLQRATWRTVCGRSNVGSELACKMLAHALPAGRAEHDRMKACTAGRSGSRGQSNGRVAFVDC